VRIPLPELPLRMTLYRIAEEVGAFAALTGDVREADFERLQDDQTALEREIGERLTFSRPALHSSGRAPEGALNTKDSSTMDAQLHWLCRVGDRFVTAMRIRF